MGECVAFAFAFRYQTVQLQISEITQGTRAVTLYIRIPAISSKKLIFSKIVGFACGFAYL